MLHGDIPQCLICHYGVQRHFTFPHNVRFPFDKCMDNFNSLWNNTKFQWKPVQLLYRDRCRYMDGHVDRHDFPIMYVSYKEWIIMRFVCCVSMLLMEYTENKYWKWDFQLEHSWQWRKLWQKLSVYMLADFGTSFLWYNSE